MPNNISIPSVVLSKLWRAPNALQLLAYLLSRTDYNNIWKFNLITIASELGQSMEKINNGLRLLEQMQIIYKQSFDAYRVETTTLSTTTELTTSFLPDEFQHFADTFNSKVKGTSIPQIRDLSDTRIRAIKNRAKEYGGIEALEAILDKVVASDFLTGRKNDFCASFDWIFKKANFIKILEGNYDNKPTATPRTTINRQADRYSALEAAAGAVIRRNPSVYPAGND